MRTLTILVLASAFLAQASFAEETILSSNIQHGVSVGPEVKFTTFNGEFAVLAGGQAGWILNHTFEIGAGAYGLATDHQPVSVPAGYLWTATQTRADMGYGGVVLSYIGLSDRVLHPTFDLLIGGGELDGHRKGDGWNAENNSDHSKVDGFFVLEPTVNAEINIVSFMRADVGAGYRFVNGITEWGFSNGDVGGPSASVELKFGKF